MRLPGRATPEGTTQYGLDHPMPDGHYRQAGGLTVSSVGHGSYLGDVGDDANQAYEDAALTCLQGGINVLDTASNYRDQRSERDVGRALQRFVQSGGARDQVLVATKAGFLHGDADSDMRGSDWFTKEYVLNGTVSPSDIAANVSCLKPEYVSRELDRSRDNLGVDTLDVFFVHNPELHLEDGIPEDDLMERLEELFTTLERRADEGAIKVYGVATWNGLRAGPGEAGHLSLVKLVHAAGQAAMATGKRAAEHRFRAVQLPVNLAMPEAALSPSQPWRSVQQPALACAKEAGMLTFASASMMQAKLDGRVPVEWKQGLGTDSDLETALQFTRSVDGVTSALVGMGRPEHAAQVLEWAKARGPDVSTVTTMMGPGGPHG